MNAPFLPGAGPAAALLISLGLSPSPLWAGPGVAKTSAGTLTPVPLPAGTAPLGLTEVAPGNFVGLEDGSPVFLLTGQGNFTTFCQTAATSG